MAVLAKLEISLPRAYASGKDELKAIYLAKTGECFPAADLDAIEAMLVIVGISWEEFAADARTHSWGRIKSPIGFLKNRAQKFRALTRESTRPVKPNIQLWGFVRGAAPGIPNCPLVVRVSQMVEPRDFSAGGGALHPDANHEKASA